MIDNPNANTITITENVDGFTLIVNGTRFPLGPQTAERAEILRSCIEEDAGVPPPQPPPEGTRFFKNEWHLGVHFVKPCGRIVLYQSPYSHNGKAIRSMFNKTELTDDRKLFTELSRAEALKLLGFEVES